MKKLTIDEFMEAWSIDRAKIVFKDGKVLIAKLFEYESE